MRSILWHFPDLPSMEHCRLLDSRAGGSLEGEVVLLREGAPATIRYRVACSPEWETRSCRVEIRQGNERREFDLARDAVGLWTRSGQPMRALDDCVDVDLGFSPSTNTLPIRRLGLDVGASRRISAAWLRFPDLEIVRSEQVYTRLADRRYRYESGNGAFRADLDVDDHGLVTRYGNYWRELTGGI